MLDVMRVIAAGNFGLGLMLLCAAVPARADNFKIRHLTRDDLPIGTGQCEIRVQVDNEVEISVHGETASVRTIAGKGARDNGSECNVSLPGREIPGIKFEVIEKRDEIRLLAEPSARNGFAAVVRIRDTSGGEGRYHFRLIWPMLAADAGRGKITPTLKSKDESDRPSGGPGFSWNNTLSFRGKGQGVASLNDFGELRLREVSMEIDRSGKVLVWFRTDGQSRKLAFNGQVMANESGRWKADVMSDDRRLRGPMWISVDSRMQVNSIAMEATDGRDRLRIAWDRK